MTDFNVFQTTIGKKILMAVTGILFAFFLLVHLLNNLTLFIGPETFNSLVSSLEYVKPLIRVLEGILLLILVIHISNAIILSYKSKKARPLGYKIKPKDSSSLSSRTMILSGTVILLFLIIHLGTFWKTFQTIHGNSSYYDIVVNNKIIGFGNPFIVILYILATIFIGIHLKHGFESSFQTLGINNPKLRNILNKLSIIFWFVIPFGFCFIAFWFGIIKKII
tara:strand:+ start:3261 stop:3926 length:666 start_codon:yes stop_codon:yes gene_type:complete